MSKFKSIKHLPKKDEVVEFLELPRDTVYHDSVVTIIGNSRVIVENYKGIIEYSLDKIVLQGKKQRIQILGKKLMIQYYTNTDMKICGLIDAIQYL